MAVTTENLEMDLNVKKFHRASNVQTMVPYSLAAKLEQAQDVLMLRHVLLGTLLVWEERMLVIHANLAADVAKKL